MPKQLAKIIADSVNPEGVRLTTMEIVVPRIVLAELNTHRMFSRNSASSRAIPIEKMLRRVVDDPYIPERWGLNGKGMQDHGELSESDAEVCVEAWLGARDKAIESVRELLKIGVHKQTTNRLLEPFMWHTVIVTATEWSNFFHQRCHPAAHPAIRRTADAMAAAMTESTPTVKRPGEWHLPYIGEQDSDLSIEDQVKVSAARCARVSYLTHDGKRDVSKDLELYARLSTYGHMSPLEHPATPMDGSFGCDTVYSSYGNFIKEGRWDRCFAGNFRGWVQHRKQLFAEHDMLAETTYREFAEGVLKGCKVMDKRPHPATTAYLEKDDTP